ncbi:MAG: AAA family ATPase [Candidatus Microsaccharimonas sp.]
MEQKAEDFSTQALGTLTIVIGLPGSGKTTYINNLADQNSQLSIYDDYQGEAYNNDSDPRLSKHFGELVGNLKKAKNVIVSDIRYCIPHELNVFLGTVLSAAPNVRIELKYFENNPEACRKNILFRNRENRVDQELELLNKLTSGYVLPSIEHLTVHVSA